MDLEILRLRPLHTAAIAKFFTIICENGLAENFHPHPFSDAEAKRLAAYEGKDLYYILVWQEEVIGYAMLRGWDEGYDIPSLGIAIHPKMQGKGLGRLLINFLHAAARLRNARKIRLTVGRENATAIKLYQLFGYTLQDHSASSLLGMLNLE